MEKTKSQDLFIKIPTKKGTQIIKVDPIVYSTIMWLERQNFSIDPEIVDLEKFAFVANRIYEHWMVAFGRFIKIEWFSQYKIPGNKLVKDSTIARGHLLVATFQLCERIHAINGHKLPWVNAGHWFACCLRDFIGNEWQDIITGYRPYSGSMKRGIVEFYRGNLNELNKHRNPFKRYPSAEALVQLIDGSLKTADISDRFRTNHWKNFLNAYSDFVEEIQKKCKRGYIDSKNRYCQIVSRNQTKKVSINT